jgi:protein-S-isoprenylcysteine O-methyltransferase Ste14
MTNGRKTLVRIAIAAALGAAIGGFGAASPSFDAFRRTFHVTVSMKLAGIVWVLFSIYWTIAAKDSAPTRTAESILSRQFHLIVVNGALLLLFLPVPGLAQRILPESGALVVVGLAIETAFALLAVWARRHLGTNWSGEVRIATGHQLVRSGPYRFVRHPIYTAIVGMYAGTCLVSGQLHALAALAVVTVAYARKIRLEEEALRQAFPQDHDVYRRETWAWIPGIY